MDVNLQQVCGLQLCSFSYLSKSRNALAKLIKIFSNFSRIQNWRKLLRKYGSFYHLILAFRLPIALCAYEEKKSKLCYTIALIAPCPILGPMRNGVITYVTRKGGGEVEIKCHANYTLSGSSRLSCINGEWSNSVPSCKGMSHTCDCHQSRSKKKK